MLISKNKNTCIIFACDGIKSCLLFDCCCRCLYYSENLCFHTEQRLFKMFFMYKIYLKMFLTKRVLLVIDENNEKPKICKWLLKLFVTITMFSMYFGLMLCMRMKCDSQELELNCYRLLCHTYDTIFMMAVN